MSTFEKNLRERVNILNEYIEQTNNYRVKLWKMMQIYEKSTNDYELKIDLENEHKYIKSQLEKLNSQTESKLNEIRNRNTTMNSSKNE